MKNNNKVRFLIGVIIIILVSIYNNFFDNIKKQVGELKNVIKENKTEIKNNIYNDNELLKVYFMDVGQADSILISYDNKYMLIDAGNEDDGKMLVDYYKNLGILKFDYVIATHPHEDHIGSMDDIINNFDIDNFFMPDVLTTTKTFENMINALEKNNLGYITPKIGDEFHLGKVKCKVLYINDDENNLNDDSIVLKINYGNNSFLFMGDASNKVEKEILNSDIKSDVLKVGHHGSLYSTSNLFLNEVKPKYGVISVGENNVYNHPSNNTINLLNSKNIKLYRTDKDGTVIFTSNKENIEILKESDNIYE